MKSCKDCMDFDTDKNECSIRFTRAQGKGKVPMKRKANQKACIAFISKPSFKL